MGNKRHQKDRGYRTATEWRTEGGGYKDKAHIPFKRLPFHCCAITFTPFDEPVCTEDGTVMDIVNAVPYIMKYKRHPVSGQPLLLKDLVQLHFAKNDEGQYHCPVMDKVFTEHTHIVAIKTTGNVYCWEAVEELNIKSKNWKDLLTDEPFVRKDIIHIQDPLNLQQRAIESFDHIQKDLRADDEEPEAAAGSSSLRNVSEDMQRVLGALQTQESKDAFASGGGGNKRVEAQRLLAAAKAAAANRGDKQAAAAASAAGGGAAAASGAPAASSSGSGEGDWRLRAPERTREAAFKPGAHTWNTEDHVAASSSKPHTKTSKNPYAQKQKEINDLVRGTGTQDKAKDKGSSDAGRQEAAGKVPGTSMSPQEWYEAQGHVRWVEGAHTTGAGSRSFTSSVVNVVTTNQRQMTRFLRNPTKKGYVRLHTNLGDINVELHCDIVPRTCENFLALCDMGYYSNTVFHRSIRNFMVQGGDPLGTGQGGESIYGKTFKDELDSRLLHSGRGILSMANSGPGTNGSQFFITYKSCAHLNYKHSVFGRVVGGFEVLGAMEKIATDDEDRPLQEIRITGTSVFTNPFYELEEEEKKQAEAERKRQALEEAAGGGPGGDPDAQFGKWFSNPIGDQGGSKAVRNGVGKYINAAVLPVAAAPAPAAAAAAMAAGSAAAAADAAAMPPPPAKKPKVASGGFGSFDAW